MLTIKITIFPRATAFARGTAAFALIALAGTGIALVDPAPVIEQGFNTALSTAPKAPQSAFGTPEAGSEAYWLGQGLGVVSQTVGKIEPAHWKTPVSKGERIVVGAGAGARVLEVVEVKAVAAETAQTDITRIDIGLARPRIQVVCRDAAAPNGPLLRFEIEAEGTPPPAAPHAL